MYLGTAYYRGQTSYVKLLKEAIEEIHGGSFVPMKRIQSKLYKSVLMGFKLIE